MNILIADKFESWGIDSLKKSGFDISYEPALEGDGLRDAVVRTGCSVLVVRGTKVPADVIEASSKLSLIVRAGAGYNTIDVGAASQRGVFVSNCPGKNAAAVAELTFGLILAIDRRIVDCAVDLREGAWNKKEYSEARGLKDRTIGIIGMGQIGRSVALRARAFEMNVVAWSRSFTQAEADELGIERGASPADVAAKSDILSIHLALANETKGLISAAVLERLAPGSYVINTARAEVMDYDALLSAMERKKLRVGLDVFPGEPSGGKDKFEAAICRGGGVVYGTHHIGASTEQAQNAIAAETLRIIQAYADTGQVPNCVNIETRSPAKCQMIVRHHDKVGVLASVLGTLRKANINVQEMSNTVFQQSRACVAAIRLEECPKPEVIAEIAGMNDLVIHVEVRPIA